MNDSADWLAVAARSGLLVDSNLLVLLTVGTVNPNRIEKFKRTEGYSKSDFYLLNYLLERVTLLYTVAHVMAEVSNLTDLPGEERRRAREFLKRRIATLNEPQLPSKKASEAPTFMRLGLVDAAIGQIARDSGCAVLTDDLALYDSLSREGITAENFTHLRVRGI